MKERSQVNAAERVAACKRAQRVSNLLSFGQVDPQLPPGGEFLPVAEVVRHLLASIAGHQRRAVLVEFVCSLHDFKATIKGLNASPKKNRCTCLTESDYD